MEKKSDTIKIIRNFITFAKRQFSANIIQFRFDKGGESVDTDTKDMLASQGILIEPSPLYSHESNGVAERFNRTITTDARTMIRDKASLFLWPQAIAMARHLRNIKPHNRLQNSMIPYQALYDQNLC